MLIPLGIFFFICIIIFLTKFIHKLSIQSYQYIYIYVSSITLIIVFGLLKYYLTKDINNINDILFIACFYIVFYYLYSLIINNITSENHYNDIEII